MPIDIHVTELVDGSKQTRTDRLMVGVQFNVANVSGGAVNVAVTTAVTFYAGSLPVDANGNGQYGVEVTPSQACFVSVTSKTGSGFNVVLTPLSTVEIAAGTFDVLVYA